MRIVCDIEANGLEGVTEIWLIVCKDIDSGEYHIFRNLTQNEEEKQKFLEFSKGVSLWIGHNWLGYDYPVLADLLGLHIEDVAKVSIDTLVISKLIDYSRDAHSIEQYGEEFGYEKIKFFDFSKYSPEMEEYCVRDVDICHKIFDHYKRFTDDPKWGPSIQLENAFQGLVNDLNRNGFAFNVSSASTLLSKVEKELAVLDKDILSQFPPKLKLVREITPRVTKYGTLNKADFRFVKDGDLSEYNGGPFCRCVWQSFNPSSHKQIISVLNDADWRPVDKTQTHINTERELNLFKRKGKHLSHVDIVAKNAILKRLEELRVTGWKVNENNLSTLPPSAPSSAHVLAKRILLEARRRTLTEWLSLVKDDGRIHGQFYGIGAWTHRMAHQKPNTANIPSEFKEDGSKKLLGKELRSLWRAPKKRLLVGVDAEGIQLRIFAHYINDPEFIDALVKGKKHDKTDPHSLNQRILGSVCKSRQAAKRFIYALLLGAGMAKLAQVLEASEQETQAALDNLLDRYEGFALLKQTIIPKDAKQGFFVGLDGRKVLIPGDTEGARRHLCMSGYLQNGEALVMKKAALIWNQDPEIIELRKKSPILFVNMVHDEFQTETSNDMAVAVRVAEIQADAIRKAGEEFKLLCPLAGSYWNDDHEDYTISTTWYGTH